MRLLLAAPLALALPACSISSDQDGFSIEIGTVAFGARHHATETRTLELDLAAGEELVIEGILGDTTVRASADGAQELVCVLSADGRTEEEAEQALRGVEVRTVRDGTRLAVVVEAPAREVLENGMRFLSQPRSDLTLRVPAGVAVRIASSAGDIEVEGPAGPVQAATSFGGVTLSRIDGGASARSDSGSIAIRRAAGGAVTAETSFGDVTLEAVSGERVLAASRSGDLVLRDVRGTSVEARSSFGDIRLSALEGDVTAHTGSGDVELVGALPGTHQLHSGFGGVDVVRAQGAIDASSDSGDVSILDSAGGVAAESGFGDITVEGVLSSLSAASSSGDVDVTARAGSAPAGDWRLSSRFGSVSLRLPPAFGCTLTAATDFGEVATDFDLALTERGPGASAQGTLAAGGPQVDLHTSSGDISVLQTQD